LRPAGAVLPPAGLSHNVLGDKTAPAGRLAELREKYPNVGKPWNKEDDALLTKMFNEKKSQAAMGEHFGRKPSAIRARLGHIGLITDVWKPKQKS